MPIQTCPRVPRGLTFYRLAMVWLASLLILHVNVMCGQDGSTPGSSPDSEQGDWIQLFNGKDINDWIVKLNHHEINDNYGDTFRVEDGLLKVRYDQYDDFGERFGHLYFKQPFSHYHLAVEYRFVGKLHKGAPNYAVLNSGVMIHSQDPKTILLNQNWPISIELQFLAGLPDGRARGTGNVCTPGTHVFHDGKLTEAHIIESSAKTYKPEEWVRAEVIVHGNGSIVHIINGEKVLEYSRPQIGGGVVAGYDPNIFQEGKALSQGFIALQSEGQPVDFRKVEIKLLSVTPWWSDAVNARLALAGANREVLVQALEQVPEPQREGLGFLIENMPLQDLKTLSAEFLLENLDMTYRAMQAAPWAGRIPSDIFLNDVLPYASVTESRDNWRQRLYDICQPLVKDCKTPGEAGQALNAQLFKLLKVKYSTKRRAPDQGPFETMETGVATCTGLSILLIDACRSVGVPARFVGTPLWSNNSGNHSWVEIWDGDWHFTGAAEQDPKGLDRGWFVGNASQAVKEDRSHAIYASSFRHTGVTFPMTWARRVDYVNAVNVTDRYAASAKPVEPDGLRLTVEVFDRPVGNRVAAKVTVTDTADQTVKMDGQSKSETSDMNDHLVFDLPKQRTYVVEVERDGRTVRQYYTTGTSDEDRLDIFLSGIPAVPAPAKPAYTPPPVTRSIAPGDHAVLKQALDAYFAATADEQATWQFANSLDALLQDNEPGVRHAAWESYLAAPGHASLKSDFEARQVRFEEHLSPYTVKTVGIRPANGWALFIAMHGGGGAPQELNDSQWRHMQIYYRDHPEAGGYLYVALRAPNNTWNGFYTGYAYSLMQNLLRQFLLFGDVDPNKQFLMGYSHGGYGAFAMGPKMPDHFAAVHSSAAAPTDGSGPITLRNSVFTCMVGTKDTMYGRYERVQNFEKEVQALRGDRTDIYPVTVQFIADHPHSKLPDRDKIAEMYPNVRNPVPRELTWQLSDNVISDFFWLHVPTPASGITFNATCRENRLKVTSTPNLTQGSLLLDSRLIDFTRPVTLDFNGQVSTCQVKPSLLTLCETMQRRGDPELAFTAEIALPL